MAAVRHVEFSKFRVYDYVTSLPWHSPSRYVQHFTKVGKLAAQLCSGGANWMGLDGARAPTVKPCVPAVPRHAVVKLSYNDIDYKRISWHRAVFKGR